MLFIGIPKLNSEAKAWAETIKERLLQLDEKLSGLETQAEYRKTKLNDKQATTK